MLLACGFIMLTRLSLDKGLDKAFKQFVIVAAAAILSWLVPFIMERFWQLYKFQWRDRAGSPASGMGSRK